MARGSRVPQRSVDASGTRPLRVLLLNWRDLDHPEGGGSELYVQTVAAELAAAGHTVTMFCAAYPGARATERRDGYRIERRGGHLSVYPWGAFSWWTRRLGDADVVVDVQNGIPFFARLWSRRPVVVLVHHVHRELWPVVMGRSTARIGWWIESKLSPRAHRGCRYITVSNATRDELVRLGVALDRITVVHNGTPLRTVVEPRSESPEICVLGRLVPHKRVEHAIRALRTLHGAFPNVRLTVVGSGYWEPQLRTLVDDLGLADSVTFTGHVDDDTKHRLLARAWVLAMPSVKEGWALSVVEAASHATPAVAYRTAGGVTESIVDGSTGMLVDTEAEFATALASVLDDSDLRRRLGAAASVHAVRFTWPTSATRFESVLRAAVAREPNAVIDLPEPPGRSTPIRLPLQPRAGRAKIPDPSPTTEDGFRIAR